MLPVDWSLIPISVLVAATTPITSIHATLAVKFNKKLAIFNIKRIIKDTMYNQFDLIII